MPWRLFVRRPTSIYLRIILKENIYPRFYKGLSLIYSRFTDDIFFIRTESKEQLIRNLDEYLINNTKNTTKLNLSTKLRKNLFWMQSCISRATNFTRKYIQNKPIGRASFISIQNIRNR